MKSVLVTLANESYIDQAKQIFSSVYFNSGWKGDYLLLAHEIPETKLEWFRQKGILTHSCKPLSGTIGRLHGVTASRFYCFSEYFKQWDHVIYFDADVIVREPLEHLTQLDSFAAIAEHYPLRGQFVPMDQASIPLYKDLANRYDLNQKSFNGGLMSFPTRLITPTTFTEIVALFNKYKSLHHFDVGEQPTLNLYFNKRWTELPYFFNAHPRGLKQYFGLNIHRNKVAAIHFATEKPWDPNHPFFSEWALNLSRADKLTVANPIQGISSPHKQTIWIRGKYFQFSQSLQYTIQKQKMRQKQLLVSACGRLASQRIRFHKAFRKRKIDFPSMLPVPASFQPKSHTYAGFSGPWIEQYFYKYWLRHGKNFSERFSRIYVPIFWTDYYVRSKNQNPKQELQEFLNNSLDPRKNYFTVVQNDLGILESTPKNLLVFSAGGTGDVPIPLLKGTIPYRNKPKKWLCSFMGSTDTEQGHFNTRKLMCEALKNEPLFFWSKGSLKDFYKITQESVFTLCPRGFGPTSFRLYESMALGSIPVYVWHNTRWLPFSEQIDWEKLAIIIPIEQIRKLPEILNNHSPELIRERQRYIKQVYNTFFTYKGTAKQIIHFLTKEKIYF